MVREHFFGQIRKVFRTAKLSSHLPECGKARNHERRKNSNRIGKLRSQILPSKAARRSHALRRSKCESLFLKNRMLVTNDCLGEGHADSVLGPQNYHRARLNCLARRKLKIVFS